MPDTTLILRRCTPEDIPSLAALHHASFGTTPGHKVMYGNVKLEDRLKFHEDTFRRKFLDLGHSPHTQSVNIICVTDTTTDKIISYVIWVYLPNGYLASEDADTHHPWLPLGTNETLAKDFDRVIGELRSADPRRKEAHWLLGLLATHPNHEGRGAGSMLIQWAFPKADEMGVPCFVDSSVAGYPVYKKRGFQEAVGSVDLDLGEYDRGEGYGVQRWVAMMREPRKDKGRVALQNIQ